MTSRVVLVVEDGSEYVDALSGLAAGGLPVELLHAQDAEAARAVLSRRCVDAVFLDVVFDRTAPEKLAGDLGALIARFSGDRARALDALARNQGFYLLSELAPLIPAGAPVLLAHDFSGDPQRLEALRKTVPSLQGVEESSTISRVLERLLGG